MRVREPEVVWQVEDPGVSSMLLAVGRFQFHALACGLETDDLVILLHGFPQFADSWVSVMPRVASAGFRVVAIDQRGYSVGARPTDVAAYGIDHLVADVLGCADVLGAQRFHVVGHDWGGLVAWQVAADHPGRLLSLSVLSTPHPDAFRRAIRSNFDQMRRSVYIALFRMRFGIPEALLLSFGAAGLRLAYQGRVSEGQVKANLRRLAQGGTLSAALNWYRALRIGEVTGTVRVPTFYVWSDGDVALGEEAALATRDFVTGTYRFERIAGLSHWLVDEAPDRMTALLVEHLGRHRAGGDEDGRDGL